MEAETEIHSQWAELWVQLKRGRRGSRSRRSESRWWWGNPKQNWAFGTLSTMDWQQECLHGTQPGPLHVDGNCVIWPDCGALVSRTRIYPWCMSWLFPVHGISYSTLMQWGGTYPSSTWCTRHHWLHMGGLTLSGGRDRGRGVGDGQGGWIVIGM